MACVHGTNVHAWKERLFGKPAFKESRLSIYNNGRILWEKEENGKQKGSAELRMVFPHIRIGVLECEVKKERAKEDGLILAYHTLILPLELSKPTPQSALQEREFALAFEREVYDWMQSFAGLLGLASTFHEIVLKYRLRKKYNVYSGSSHYGLSQVEDTLGTTDDGAGDGGDPARLWSAAHGASEDYVAIWGTFQEQALEKLAPMKAITNANGYSCVNCWKA